MEAELKPLVAARGTIKARLTMFKKFVESSASETDLIALEKRVKANEGLYEKFDAVQSQIEVLVVESAVEMVHSDERDAFETTFFNVMASAERCISDRRGPSTLNAPSSASATGAPSPVPGEAQILPRLPTIALPTFDGSYSKWVRFRDTFLSLIHTNEKLTDMQRFQYLSSALKGPAARVIESLGVSEANYQVAWPRLKARYEDSQALVHHHTSALLDLPSIKKSSGTLLREFVDDSQNHIAALGALGQPVDSWDTIVILLLSKKLDSATIIEWEEHLLQMSEGPKFSDFVKFLEKRSKLLERTVSGRQATGDAHQLSNKFESRKQKNKNQSTLSAYVANNSDSCLHCKGNHLLQHCAELKSMPHSEMHATIKKLRCCFNCFQLGHSVKACTRGTCRKCGRKHNTLLHRVNVGENSTTEIKDQSGGSESQPDETEPIVHAHVSNSRISELDFTVLSTALVYVEDVKGNQHECYALLDAGSQAHFVTDQFCKRLGLRQTSVATTVGGLGRAINTIEAKTQVVGHARSGSFQSSLSCLVIPTITDNMPNAPLKRADIAIPAGITLADPRFAEPKRIDLLIGAALFWQLLCIGQHRVTAGLVWQKTRLGWVLGGSLNWPVSGQKGNITACHAVVTSDLHRAIERFWEVEDGFSNQRDQADPLPDACERHFSENTIRDNDGRFVVGIPFNSNIGMLGESRAQAEKRLLAMERKFVRQPELRHQYIEFMTEYEELGHMTRINEQTRVTEQNYYLPHHAVFKEASTTTKMRVVFDGSAKSSSGISLNETQMVGPIVQSDLFAILIRFRKHKFVLSADVTKMYRQIRVRQEDRRFQRILWRYDPKLPIATYELATVTYGTASAPYLATRVLTQIGRDQLEHSPVTAQVIMTDFYVDDLLTGCETLIEARKLRDDLTDILGQAGFPLRKWASNDRRTLMRAPDSRNQIEFHTGDKDPKTLGLLWLTQSDELGYTAKVSLQKPITKRGILSQIAQIFDPLGLIGPVVVKAKIIMQQLWQIQVGWDESLPQDLHTEWFAVRMELDQVSGIRIPRRVLCDNSKIVELHGFADASEKAYGACIYIRSLQSPGTWVVRLLCAKSRVAPLKSLSLPRLELCAALTLAQLADRVKRVLQVDLTHEHYWSDSMIVLAWIQNQPTKWKTFVANRVAEVQRLTPFENWSHVVSEENPADIISRGASPVSLINNELWWFGPRWLSQRIERWPIVEGVMEGVPEERQPQLSCYTAAGTSTAEGFGFFDRFSNYSILRRAIARCFRFIRMLRNRISKNMAPSITTLIDRQFLTADEISEAERALVKIAQAESFAIEIKYLTSNKSLPDKGKLVSLNPFLDKSGILRVGGRLVNAPVVYDQKHPMILSSHHPLTTLLIEFEHRRLLHAGCQHTLASLRTRFWPISGKRVVKQVLHRCIRCFKTKPTSAGYLMGNLPAARVTPARAFTTCGVDYAGPFQIKEKGRTRVTHKAYICLFVCFVTKAVHVELATDLTTDAFLNCLHRFIARRGRSHCIYSDNGTNFIGARNELNELGILLRDKCHNDQVHASLAQEQIQWHLIPPRSPHFGGLWESAIKSVKYHLKRVIGEQRLTFEELYTVLTQVEACLNSRPLHPLSVDPQDLTPLTPGHFLIGDAITALPQPDLLHLRQNRLNRYQLIQQTIQHFWKRWRQEYLHELQQRNKWRSDSSKAPTIGALVIICEDNLPPLRWQLGRIVELHRGADGIARVASVRIADGVVKRPVVKLCMLPLATEDTTE